ncbi:MAG: hypothetical protein LBQ46_13510 [Treponema sp.]|jgi:hypothetical protein|nr:hypothetical protein [Treponema sp.]
MKGVLPLTALLIGLFTQAGFGQEAPYRSAHYEISGGTGDAAQRIAGDLEGRFAVYTRLFRFKAQSPDLPLRVRLISDPGAYDAYVAGQLGEKREGAVYLHFRQEDRRELVVHYQAPDSWGRALPYQSFIQYLRFFIPNPPSWIQKGFAIYFSGLSFSDTGELGYRENLSWLERVKAMSLPPVQTILLADTAEDPELPGLDALSWSLVSFFLNSGDEDNFRTLLECFMLLSPQAGAAENSLALARRIEDWNGFEELDASYQAYLDSRSTFPELLSRGRQAYMAGDSESARSAFLEALDLQPEIHAPYYYLGLIAYENGKWEEAEWYYRQSLELGAEQALVYYALGLNAAAALQREKAAEYLNAAVQADPLRYREKAETLLRRLPGR